MANPMGNWYCKIGNADGPLPHGCDYPMRRAVERAYREITGQEPDFIFSGWSAQLTDSEQRVLDADERRKAGLGG